MSAVARVLYCVCLVVGLMVTISVILDMIVIVTNIVLMVVRFGFMPIFWFTRVRCVVFLMCDSVFFLCVV